MLPVLRDPPRRDCSAPVVASPASEQPAYQKALSSSEPNVHGLGPKASFPTAWPVAELWLGRAGPAIGEPVRTLMNFSHDLS